MTVTRERSDHRAQGVFDVRDAYRELQVADGLPARVPGPKRFAVRAVVTPAGRLEPDGWSLDTRRTLSGLSVFLDRVVQGRRSEVVRTLPASTTQVEIRVLAPRFQGADLAFRPDDTDPYHPVMLEPAVDYLFTEVTTRPDEIGPSLLRGSVQDEVGTGVLDAVVTVAEGLYDYRTDGVGGWVVVLPDDLAWPPAAPVLPVEVGVTLPPGPWRTAAVVAGPPGGPAWTGDGPVRTCAITARRGSTVPVPALRLRLP